LPATGRNGSACSSFEPTTSHDHNRCWTPRQLAAVCPPSLALARPCPLSGKPDIEPRKRPIRRRYSIISSARTSTVGGTSRPSTLAVPHLFCYLSPQIF
jgi:hypothetical protein